MIYIPPAYRKKEWMRLFSGIIIGTILGYLFFLFIHGQLQEKYAEEHIELTTEMNQLEAKYEGLLKENREGQEYKPLRVLDINIQYTNAKKLEVDLLTQHQLTNLIKEQLTSITGKDLRIIAEQDELIISTIENKNYVIDDFSYGIKVTKLIVSEIVRLELKIELSL